MSGSEPRYYFLNLVAVKGNMHRARLTSVSDTSDTSCPFRSARISSRIVAARHITQTTREHKQYHRDVGDTQMNGGV